MLATVNYDKPKIDIILGNVNRSKQQDKPVVKAGSKPFQFGINHTRQSCSNDSLLQNIVRKYLQNSNGIGSRS